MSPPMYVLCFVSVTHFSCGVVHFQLSVDILCHRYRSREGSTTSITKPRSVQWKSCNGTVQWKSTLGKPHVTCKLARP